MTPLEVQRSVRGTRFAFEITGRDGDRFIVAGRNLDAGSEATYVGAGGNWERRIWRNGRGTSDRVLDQDLTDVLVEVVAPRRR